MITRHKRGKITWVDLESPTHDELAGVMREFGIDERIEEEIISPTPYPITISFPKYQYLILHFPTADPSAGTRNQEIDLIVGKTFIITARYEVIDTIHNLHRVFEAEELLGFPNKTERADVLLERLIRRLYGAIREEMEHASRILERIERDMFSGKERTTVHAISDIGRVLLRFETTLVRHSEPLDAFLTELGTPAFFGKSFREHATHIEAERKHVADLVSSYRAAASELRTTNDSLLSASQNEVMKTLTVVTFIVFPLSLIAALFQMNVADAPLANSPHAFWLILAFMVCISGILAFYAFKKKWL